MTEDRDNRVKLISIFWTYIQVGLTAFGFSALQKIKTMIQEKKWLNESEMEEGLALVQLYPGPIMVNLNTYIGYKLRGLPGALLSTLGFITPTTIFMIVLSSIYFSLGQFPWIRPVFTGLEAIVVGILINVTLDFGKRGIGNSIQALIAFAAFSVLVLHLNVVYLVLLALVSGALFLKPAVKKETENVTTKEKDKGLIKRWSGVAASFLLLCVVIIFSFELTSDNGKAALSFFKVGSIAFGNGLTILPLIQADVVDKFHWLTITQFVDGIALSQLTPGPFLVIATFVGFKIGGIWASLLTTFAIFSPSFVLTLFFTEIFSRVKNLVFVRGALKGVLAAFVGLLVAMVLQLGTIIAGNTAALIFAAGSFAAVRFLKLDILWIFAGGLFLWVLLYAGESIIH